MYGHSTSGPDTTGLDMSGLRTASTGSGTSAGWTSSGGWVGLAVSHRGAGHIGSTPNQDAALIAPIVTGPGELGAPMATASTPGGLVAAVADGHGGRPHVRSDLGSQIAVQLAVHLVLDRGQDLASMMTSMVDRWRGEVRHHAALNPFTKAEKAVAQFDLDAEPVFAYGSTLLIAVARGDDVQLAQLGDGDALALVADGPSRPVPHDHRLVANATTSLCLPGAIADVRFARPAGSRLVLLATDGVGNAYPEPDWWSSLLEHCEWLAERGLDQLAEHLPQRVAAAAEAGGDDATIAVLLRARN